MKNINLCSLAILVGILTGSTSANDVVFAYGSTYAPSTYRAAVPPVTTVRVTPYTGPTNAYAPITRIAPHYGAAPVQTIPTRGDDVRRNEGIVRTARATRPIAPQRDRDESAYDDESRRPSPFSGRHAILDSRLTTGSVIR